MRLRHIPGSEETVANDPHVITDPCSYRGRFDELFGRSCPLMTEIGCGKGKFITELAQSDPATGYIGIERYSSVLLYALKKLEGREFKNLFFICADASSLGDIFASGEVDGIYLNFPDPWPKDRHAGRRLTSPRFLDIYKNILKDRGLLELKTDNEGLFDYSLSALRDCGWKISGYTLDLYADGPPEKNIQTEYEKKFSDRGSPIYKLTAVVN